MASESFASLRLRPIQAKNRSTTQRRGFTAKPIWSGFLRTISTAINHGCSDLLPGISAVGEDALDEREHAAGNTQKRSAAVAILDARRMRFEHEATPFGVNERVALAPVDLLSRIVTAWAAGLGGLDALAVDDRGRGAGVAPDPFTICHHERMVYPFKAPIVAPGGKPAVNRPHGGKSFGSRRHGQPARMT